MAGEERSDGVHAKDLATPEAAEARILDLQDCIRAGNRMLKATREELKRVEQDLAFVNINNRLDRAELEHYRAASSECPLMDKLVATRPGRAA